METTMHIEKEILPVVFGKQEKKGLLTEKGFLFIEGSEGMPYGLRDYSLYSKEAPQDVWDGQIFSSIRLFKERWVAYIPPDSLLSHLSCMYIVAYEGARGEAYTIKLVRVLDDKDISSTENFIYWEQICGWPRQNKKGRYSRGKRILRESSLIREIVYSTYYTEAEVGWSAGELVVEIQALFRKSLQRDSAVHSFNLAKIEIPYIIDVENQKSYGSPRGELQISFQANPYSDWDIPCQRHLEEILEEILMVCPQRINPVLTISRLFSFCEIEQNICNLLIPCTISRFDG